MGTEGLRRGYWQSEEVGLRRSLGHFSPLCSTLHHLDPYILAVCYFSSGGTFTSLRSLPMTDVVVVPCFSLLVNLYCFFNPFTMPLVGRVGVGHVPYPVLCLL